MLMDMLPRDKVVSPVSPVSSEQSWKKEPHSIQEISAATDTEAQIVRAHELDAEAPGPHIQELGIEERALELESQRPIAELEGGK